MATLINGDGNAAVYAAQDSDWFAGVEGNTTKILKVGSKMEYEIEDANTIAIKNGVLVTKEGRRVQIDAGAIDEFIIPTGTQGVTRYFIIGYHLYTDASSNQLCETFVQLMANGTDTIPEDTFRGGSTDVYVSLYRVKQDGITLDTIQSLLPEGVDLDGIGDEIDDIKDDIDQINSDLTALTPEATKWSQFAGAVNQEAVAQSYYFGFNGSQNPIYPVSASTLANQLVGTGLASSGTISVTKNVGISANTYSVAQFISRTISSANSGYRATIGFENSGVNASAIFLDTNNTMGIIYNNGATVWFSTTTPSSRRIKENIEPIANDEAIKLLDLDVVSFDYDEKYKTTSSESTRQYGLIAEDVKDIIPNCVAVPADYDENDESDDVNVLSIKYEKLVPQLLKLVQIQQKQIDELTERVEALESK